MIFLPVVERELRVAARKGSTSWVRMAAALAALIIGAGFLMVSHIGNGSAAKPLGDALFATLTWLSLAASLAAGLFFTSDSLSEEKREGTLGFLFLTDLRGHDVVLGKLLATSLRGFYGLLATFPILAITLMMGGVTGTQLWLTALALATAMFLSLAAGLFVSALSRDSQKALVGTLLLIVLLTGGGPLGDALIAKLQGGPFQPLLSLSSPVYLFSTAHSWSQSPFPIALLINQGIAWTLLGLACYLVPRTWQEKPTQKSTFTTGFRRWWKFGGPARQAALRRKLIDVNAVLWLACRERWQALGLWLVTAIFLGGLALVAVFGGNAYWWIAWNSVASLWMLVLYLGITSQAVRFHIEAQRSGLIELLLSTPLSSAQIIQGQWRALLRMFGPALALCLLTQLTAGFLAQRATGSLIAGTAAQQSTRTTTKTKSWNGSTVRVTTTVTVTNGQETTTTTTSTSTTPGSTNITSITSTTNITNINPGSPGASGGLNPVVLFLGTLMSTLAVAGNLAALIWFGMWMGLTSKNASQATLKTLVFVQVIPWFGIMFLSAILFPLLLFAGGASSRWSKMATSPSALAVWYPLIFPAAAAALGLIKDASFLLWARRRLYSQFRERASRRGTPIAMGSAPPPLPPPPPPPPPPPAPVLKPE